MELFSTVGLPRRALSVFLLVCAALPAYVWLEPIVRSLGSGEPPALLDHNTTLVTEALDVALIVPANLLAAALVWRRNPRGYLLAWVMLAFLVLISMGVALQTAFQVSADIDFAPAEIYGPITGFLTVGAVAMYFVVRLLRRATITENEPPRRAASAPASPVDITDPAQSSQ